MDSVQGQDAPEKETKISKAMGWGTFSDRVLITMVDKDVLEGRKEPYDGDRYVVAGNFNNGVYEQKYGMGSRCKPLAWMPFPEPAPGRGE